MLSDQDDIQEIEQAAVRLLATREHTKAELRRKLSSRGDQDVLERVLDGLANQKLQSDERFVEQYIQSRQRKGFGPVRIRQELKERGVSSELIGDWLDERDKCWRELMKEACERKFGSEIPEDFKAKAKIARFLEYRGFVSEQIRHFLRNGE